MTTPASVRQVKDCGFETNKTNHHEELQSGKLAPPCGSEGNYTENCIFTHFTSKFIVNSYKPNTDSTSTANMKVMTAPDTK